MSRSRYFCLVYFISGFLCGYIFMSCTQKLIYFLVELDHESFPKKFEKFTIQHRRDKDEKIHDLYRHVHENSNIAKVMKENVRIHCWIMVSENDSRVFLVNQTWVHRCNKHVFITADKDSDLPTLDLHLKNESRFTLWGKTKSAFKWIYENELDNFDWFLKADADTFVVIENLRFLLLAYFRDDPVYFGCKFKPYIKQGYMSGGSGYVLSREALRKFIAEGLTGPKKCSRLADIDRGPEDALLGLCMERIGIIAGDSRDTKGKYRMLPFGPMAHFQTESTNVSIFPPWFYKYMFYSYKQGEECCSDYVISFHYVHNGTMLMLNDLIYRRRVFAVSDDIMEKLRNDEVGGKPLFEAARELAVSNSVPFEVMEAESNKMIKYRKLDYNAEYDFSQ